MSYFSSLIKTTYLQAKNKDFSPVIFPDTLSPEKEAYASAFRKEFEYLQKDFLPEELLQKKLRYFRNNYLQLKAILLEGYRLCLAVFPTTEMGYMLNDEQIQDRNYFYQLFVNPKGLTYNFSFYEGQYFSILPLKIQEECSFHIHYNNGPEQFVTEEDFTKICKSYIDAFNNLRSFFGLEKIIIERN